MTHKLSRAILLACASWVLAAATVMLGFTAPALAHDTLKLEAPKPPLAPTPPMGWNSWNKFACNVISKQVRGSYGGKVASHGVVMVRITPVL